MKKLFFITIIYSNLFALAGFGLNLDQSMYSVSKSSTSLTVENIEVGEIIHHGFDNGIGFGGYFYIDAIPMVDLDLEGKLLFSSYDFSFNNAGTGIDKQTFGWADAAFYITIQKKLFQLKIPFLAKAKLTAGAGINTHSSTPMINQEMMESVMGGAENLENGTLDTGKLEDYLKDNKISTSGFHLQTGIQFKLLMLDSFLYYRHVLADDVVPGNNGFGSLNLRLGMGI